MAQDSKIEWTDHTANIWWGCTKVHAGCDHCYAETLSNRWLNDLWGNDKPRKVIKGFFSDLAKYQKIASEAGEVHRVFVGSMMDIFEKPMPLIDSKGNQMTTTTGDLREMFFDRITAGDYPNLMFLLLTKRPSNINKYIPDSWKEQHRENVMFGTSPVDQETFDKLVPQLIAAHGNRFLSIEPQLGAIDLYQHPMIEQHIDWIIQGGESGHHRRPFDLAWARTMRDSCNDHGIPYFFKQVDKVLPIPEDLMIRQFPS